MKILLQVALVFGIYWVGQGIEAVLPFAFPASVISLLLLLVLLLTGMVRVDHIREKSVWAVRLTQRLMDRGGKRK